MKIRLLFALLLVVCCLGAIYIYQPETVTRVPSTTTTTTTTNANANAAPPHPSSPDRLTEWTDIALRLGRENPRNGADWLAGNAPPDTRDLLLSALIGRWAADRPLDAAAWIQSRSDLPRESLVPALISTWSETNPQAAAAWLESQTPSEAVATGLMELANGWAAREPIGALRWAGHLPDPTFRNRATITVLSQWAQRDPLAASGAIPGLDGELQPEAAKQVSSAWFDRDPVAARQWVHSLENTSLRDPAIAGALETLTVQDPAKAIGLTEAIRDPERRRFARTRVVEAWMLQDRLEATSWITKSGLPNPEKEELLRLPRRE